MRVHVNGVSIFFEVVGTKYALDGPRMREKPTLILLHGGPGVNDHSAYRPIFESLADVAQLVLIDHRGNGRSEYGSTEHWTLAQWGDDLHAFCEALDIRQPVVLGNSFGGMVAMSYATRHPEHPGRLVVSSTMARGSRYYFDASVAMFERLGGKKVGELARRFHTGTFTDELIDEWTKKAFPVYTQSPSQLTNADAQSRIVVSLDVARHFVTGEMRTFDMLNDLAKVRCPTLLMAGELDPICPIEAADDIASAIPGQLLTYHRYPKCGHGAYRDVPEAFEELRRFVTA